MQLRFQWEWTCKTQMPSRLLSGPNVACSLFNSENTLENISKIEWELLPQILLHLSVKLLVQSWLLTQVVLRIFQSIQPRQFRYLVLRKLSSERWRQKERHQNMVWFSIQVSSAVQMQRARVKFPDTWLTSVQLHHVLTVSVSHRLQNSVSL